MNLHTRRILYSFFIALFLIAAPPLVLYTAGFRYDFKYKRIIETGSMVVKSNPEGALIFINGEQYKDQTPTIINTIPPGKINLLVQKQGYHDWEKEVEIYERVTAFEDSIKLYPTANPEPILSKLIIDYWWNNKYDKIAYATKDGELRMFNTLNKKDLLIANVKDKKLKEFKWSYFDDQFLFSRISGKDEEYFIVDADFFEKMIRIDSIINIPIESAQWDQSAPNTLYAISGGSLYRIPYLLQTARLVYKGPVESYLAEKSRIIFIEKDKSGENFVSWISKSNTTTIHIIPSFSPSSSYKLVRTNSHRIALYREKTKDMAIIDPSIQITESGSNKGESVVVIPSVIGWLWSNDGKTLLYTDEYGVYKREFTTPISVIPSKNLSQLVVKYSKPINEIAWSESESRILYSMDNSLRVARVNSSSEPRSIVLSDVSASKIQTIQKQDIITFISKDGFLMAIPLSIENSGPGLLRGKDIGGE